MDRETGKRTNMEGEEEGGREREWISVRERNDQNYQGKKISWPGKRSMGEFGPGQMYCQTK